MLQKRIWDIIAWSIFVANILLIVLVVLIVALPSCERGGKIAAGEAGPIANLRTISSGQELYNARNGEYASLSDLYTSGQYIDETLATAIDPENAKSGYYFILRVGKDGQTWSCIARPSEWGFTGTRNFFIDQIGTIYYNKTENSSEFVKMLGE